MVCPLLRVLHLNLDGSHRGNSTITSGALKVERSDGEGEDSDDEDSSLRKGKKKSFLSASVELSLFIYPYRFYSVHNF